MDANIAPIPMLGKSAEQDGVVNHALAAHDHTIQPQVEGKESFLLRLHNGASKVRLLAVLGHLGLRK